MNHDMNGARVLVTGGAGLIGSHVVDKLLTRGASVYVLDDFSEGHIENLRGACGDRAEVDLPLDEIRQRYCHILQQDVSSPACLPKVDFVFHLAGHLLQKSQSLHRGAINANILGSYNIFEAALRMKVKKLVFTSSISVFGSPRYVPVDESHPWDGNTIYGMTKLAGELMLRDFGANGLDYSIVRPSNIYGPRQSPKNGSYAQVLPIWLGAIRAGEPILIYGDGEQTMDLVHAEDAAEFHSLVMERGRPGEAYNLGTNVSTSANVLARILCEEMGVPDHPIRYEAHDVSRVKLRCTDISKARKELGFVPKFDVRAGIRDTVRWFKENRC